MITVMGINDIATLSQEDDIRGMINESCYSEDMQAQGAAKEKKKRTAKKTEKADDNLIICQQNKTALIKEEKKNKKRNTENIEPGNVDHQPKKSKTRSLKPDGDNTETAINDKKKKTKREETKETKSEKDCHEKAQNTKLDKKVNDASQQKKACRPKQLIFTPIDNDVIPDAHLSIRQAEVDNNEKKKQNGKNGKPNELILTVISDINIMLKPHESYLFKLNGYLQSMSKNLSINMFSEQQISYQRDLCALNWVITYNDDNKALIVPIYNQGNRTQKIQANDAIAIIRVQSPDAKIVLKPSF